MIGGCLLPRVCFNPEKYIKKTTLYPLIQIHKRVCCTQMFCPKRLVSNKSCCRPAGSSPFPCSAQGNGLCLDRYIHLSSENLDSQCVLALPFLHERWACALDNSPIHSSHPNTHPGVFVHFPSSKCPRM